MSVRDQDIPLWANGEPYYCKHCGLGGPEFFACEMPYCKLESESVALERRRRYEIDLERR